MSFTLRIFIMGLVAVAQDDSNSQLAIILQKAEHGHAHEAYSKEEIASVKHIPILIYPCGEGCDPRDAAAIGNSEHVNVPDHVEEETGRLFLQAGNEGAREYFGGLLLSGERVGFSNTQAGSASCLQGLRGKTWFGAQNRLPKTELELEDCSWIPHMGRVSPRARFIRKDVVENPSDSEIAGLLRLKGVLSTLRVFSLADRARRDKDMIYSFKFKEPGVFEKRVSKQGLADILVLDVPIKSDMTTITLEKFGGHGARFVELRPRNGAEIVEIFLGNVVPLDIRQEVPVPLSPVEHFKLYYSLAEAGTDVEIRFPHPGRHKVLRSKVERRKLPSVITLLNGGCDGSGGTCRPICTCDGYQLPPGL